ADRTRGADRAADPARAGRSSVCAASRRRVQGLARTPPLYLGFRRQAYRRAPDARLGPRRGARDPRRQEPYQAGTGLDAAAPARFGAAGLARTRPAGRDAGGAAALLAVAADCESAVAAALCGGVRGESGRRADRAVGRL